MSVCSESAASTDFVIVDDDKLVLELVARKLRRTGTRLKCFTETDATLDYLDEHTTRVLIVDQRMPKVDGIDLLQEISASSVYRRCPMFLCSVAPLPEDIRRRADKMGVRPLSKEIYRDAVGLVALLETT